MELGGCSSRNKGSEKRPFWFPAEMRDRTQNEEGPVLEKFAELISTQKRPATQEAEKIQLEILVAKFWIENQPALINPSQFKDTILYSVRIGLFNTDKEFHWLYRTETLNKRRDNLVVGGLLAVQAEKFLRWFKELRPFYRFRAFDITLLGAVPTFSVEMDHEILTTLFNQEKLTMDDVYIDWNIKWKSQELAQMHNQHIVWRYNQVKVDVKKMTTKFDFGSLQISLKEFREHYHNEFGVEQLPVAKGVHGILNSSTFDGRDYLHWINLAINANCLHQLFEFKDRIENYICSEPPKIRNDLIRTKLMNLLTDETGDLPNQSQGLFFDHVIMQLVREGMDSQLDQLDYATFQIESADKATEMFDEIKQSLVTLYPLFESGKSGKLRRSLSAQDTTLFIIFKKIESVNPGHPTLKTFMADLQRLFLLKEPGSKLIPPHQLDDIVNAGDFSDEDQKWSNFVKELTPPKEPTHPPTFSKQFKVQEIIDTRWKNILQLIFDENWTLELLHDETWESIRIKVNFNNDANILKNFFFEKVLDDIKKYTGEDRKKLLFFSQLKFITKEQMEHSEDVPT